MGRNSLASPSKAPARRTSWPAPQSATPGRSAAGMAGRWWCCSSGCRRRRRRRRGCSPASAPSTLAPNNARVALLCCKRVATCFVSWSACSPQSTRARCYGSCLRQIALLPAVTCLFDQGFLKNVPRSLGWSYLDQDKLLQAQGALYRAAQGIQASDKQIRV